MIAPVKSASVALCLACLCLPAVAASSPAAPSPAAAPDPRDTLFLADPAVSAHALAFAYDGDLFIAGRDGSGARRVTTAPGVESNPVFSPDGGLLAFTGSYDGNLDVYVMPAGGGEPRRLTWHPGPDVALGFTADGKSVLFSSPRSVHTGRYRHLYTVPVGGGVPERLPVPSAYKAAFSPDGKKLAYQPLRDAFTQWKNYRGGTTARLFVLDLATLEAVQVPQPPGRCNDTDPSWIGGTLYFASDRDGEFNLYAYDAASRAVTRLTEHTGFPVADASAGGGVVVYEQGFRLHVYDPAARRATALAIGVDADRRETRPRFASGREWIRGASLGPDAKRVAFEFRGEIVTVPAEKGEPRNLTRSPGAYDRNPAWSPDGKTIAYISDEGGENALMLADPAGEKPARRIELKGAGYYDLLRFSPDGKRIAIVDGAQALWVVEVDGGRATKVGQEEVYSPLGMLVPAWSPDSRWLTYSLNLKGLVRTVYLWSVADGKSYQVTDGLTEMRDPVFDAGGKFLYMLGSVDAGPLKDWFALSSLDMTTSYRVFALTLAKDGPSPIPPESDEVSIEAEGDTPDRAPEVPAEKAPSKDEKSAANGGRESAGAAKDAKADGDDKNGKDGKDGKAAKKVVVKVDVDGLSERILPLPVEGGMLRDLAPGAAGEIWFLDVRGRTGFDTWTEPGDLKQFTLEKREVKTVAKNVAGFAVSRDGKKVLCTLDGVWVIGDASKEITAASGALAVDKVSVRVDPRAEWPAIFDDAWRINRDYFYATNYHGVDWDAVKRKYRPYVDHAATRADIERIIVRMASELSVGHSYSSPGDTIQRPASVPVGLLGADYEVAGDRFRFARIYVGTDGSPEARSPLRAPGVSVREGEYLLAVEGVPVRADGEVHRFFENTAGKQVRITVGPDPEGKGSRVVTVVPLASESILRYRDWVESNIRAVDAATGGRVAYVHVPDTSSGGHASFKRYFFPQTHKDAIIVDERFNGGGLLADYVIDHLRRPYVSNWAMRQGRDLVSPRGSIFGPKVMLIDETAGSGGDLLPWMFRKFQLGPLVGRRTWGGLVGILGFPPLMDGAAITAPNFAFWNEDGWRIENEGVPPDIEVEQTPKDFAAGRDAQLQKAIEVALLALKTTTSPVPKERPPYPVRNPRGPK